MLQVKRIINNPIDSNSYIIYSDNSNKCIIVDPGTKDSESLILFLNTFKLEPEYIFLTHYHFDHVWGASNLVSIFNSKIICSKECYDIINIPDVTVDLFYNNSNDTFEINKVDILVEYDTVLNLGEVKLEIISSPGHTKGDICLKIENNLFTGDILLEGINPTHKIKNGGDYLQFKKSLNYILSIKDINSTKIYPGHGKEFYINDNNEFIKYFNLVLL